MTIYSGFTHKAPPVPIYGGFRHLSPAQPFFTRPEPGMRFNGRRRRAK
jgi:hypothetical protein